ncbi:hypothetical protein FS842_006253 [Serendipita sp. 407]|nr:hypothetical protein FS842_006253 [Serendipita sp. 407]
MELAWALTKTRRDSSTSVTASYRRKKSKSHMLSQQSDSKTNFLCLIPTEIWREILAFIPLHPAIDVAGSADFLPFLSYEEMPYGILKDMLTYRLNLLTLCKTLHPLAEELLYSKIGIATDYQMRCFREAASRLISGRKQRRRGETTTHIWILDQSIQRSFDIRTVCPNLCFLFINNRERAISFIGFKVDGGCLLQLTTLDLNYGKLGWEELRTVAVCFPRLTTLKFSVVTVEGLSDEITTQPIVFPELRLLKIQVSTPVKSPIHKLKLPSLHWLHLVVSDAYLRFEGINESMDSFLQTVSQTLVGMVVHVFGSTIYYSQIYNQIFPNLPVLQTFACNIGITVNREPRLSIPSHDLSHLIINISTSRYSYSPEHLNTYIGPFTSRHVFPRLDEVTLVFSGEFSETPLSDMSEKLVGTVQTLFPYAAVKGKNTRWFRTY